MMSTVQEGGSLEVLSTRLRSLRRAQGWSQEELADRAGLDQTQISSWERGSRRPSMESVARLARAFGVKHEELARDLGYLDDPPDGAGPPRPPDLPAPLVEAMEEMIRKYPELRAQIAGWRDEPERPARIVDLARFLGIVIRGWVDDLGRPDDGR